MGPPTIQTQWSCLKVDGPLVDKLKTNASRERTGVFSQLPVRREIRPSRGIRVGSDFDHCLHVARHCPVGIINIIELPSRFLESEWNCLFLNWN